MVKDISESQNWELRVKVISSLIFKSTNSPPLYCCPFCKAYIFFLQSNTMQLFVWMPAKGHNMSLSLGIDWFFCSLETRKWWLFGIISGYWIYWQWHPLNALCFTMSDGLDGISNLCPGSCRLPCRSGVWEGSCAFSQRSIYQLDLESLSSRWLEQQASGIENFGSMW